VNGSGLRPEADAAPVRREADAKAGILDEETREAWAAALGAAVPPAPVAPELGVEEPEPTPGLWRPSDVSMTEMGDEVARADGRVQAPPEAALPPVVSRLETTVSGGELGRVSFIVDRSNAGLSIVVEVSGKVAAGAVDAEKQTLLRTLRAAGLTVLSFRVLVRGGSGTGLAERTSGSHAKGASPNRLRYSSEPLDVDEDPEDARVRVVG
jgi:hypothetical protein